MQRVYLPFASLIYRDPLDVIFSDLFPVWQPFYSQNKSLCLLVQIFFSPTPKFLSAGLPKTNIKVITKNIHFEFFYSLLIAAINSVTACFFFYITLKYWFILVCEMLKKLLKNYSTDLHLFVLTGFHEERKVFLDFGIFLGIVFLI